MRKQPALPLHTSERAALRRARIALAALADQDAAHLASLTALPLERCRYLIALCQFQRLASVGPATAEDLWRLGYRQVADLAGADPRQMYRRLEQLVGQRLDPCVEDVFRCAAAQATFPDLPARLRAWWAWCDQRGLPLPPTPPES